MAYPLLLTSPTCLAATARERRVPLLEALQALVSSHGGMVMAQAGLLVYRPVASA